MDKIPTCSNLSRRGVIVTVTYSGCVMCRGTERTTQHLFFDCNVAQRVWSVCFRWIGTLGVQHKDLKVHFESFFFFHLNSQNLVWKGR